MSIICFPNGAYLSETSRMIAVYKKLKELGADASMVTHGGTFEFGIKTENIPYDLIEPHMSEEQCQRYICAGINGPDGYIEKEYLLEEVRNEMEYFRKKNAKAVISGFSISAALSARGVGIPLVVSHMGSFVPPVLERKMFECGEHFDNIFTDFIPTSWMNRFFTFIMLNMPFQTKIFNAVAKELNIEPVRGIYDIVLGDLTLITDVPEILTISEDDIEAWRPPNTRAFRPNARLKYSGAMFARLFGEVPDDVKDFLKTDKPKVYVALSSSTSEYNQLVYNTLASMDVRAVLCSMVHNGEFGNADNIMVKDYLPSHLVMPMCDLAIIHGGQGSVQTAIAAGVPLIGFPLQPEQNFNVKLMERHNSGICMSVRSLKKGKLRPVIETIINDGSYKKNMEKLQVFQAKRDGALEVAKCVIELVG